MNISKPVLGALSLALLTSPASANNVGENIAWQFQTTADKVNQAAIQDMIQKRKSGYYAAPIYTTNIERQYNCNVSATAQGNQGTNSTIANSPTGSICFRRFRLCGGRRGHLQAAPPLAHQHIDASKRRESL